jgi:thioredoxin-related protein
MSDEVSKSTETVANSKKRTSKKAVIALSVTAAVLVAAVAVVFLVVKPFGGKRAKPDEFGWYHDYDEAKRIAAKQNMPILLFVSMTGEDDDSATLKEKVFNTTEFKDAVADAFVPVNLDFTQAAYKKTVASEGATDKEQKAADAYAAKLKKDMQVATMFNVQMTPAVYLVTKDGYYVSFIAYDKTIDTPAAYTQMLEDRTADVKKVNDMADAVKNSSGVEKVKAIDALYEATDNKYRLFLEDMYRKVPELDKKNESGLVSKYVLATANSDAVRLFGEGDYAGAAKVFGDAGAGGRLDKNDVQQAYYTAGYLLGSTGSHDYAAITAYLQASYDADPESEHAGDIMRTLDNVKAMASAEAAAAQAQSDTAPEK